MGGSASSPRIDLARGGSSPPPRRRLRDHHSSLGFRSMTEIPGPYRTPHGLDAALRQQLLARSNAVLATINPDGSPHLTELLFYLDDEDRILLPTPHTTKKVKNVLARPTVTVFVSVESGWASCTGTARVITGDEAARLNRLNRERVLTEAGMATMGLLLAAYEDTTHRDHTGAVDLVERRSGPRHHRLPRRRHRDPSSEHLVERPGRRGLRHGRIQRDPAPTEARDQRGDDPGHPRRPRQLRPGLWDGYPPT